MRRLHAWCDSERVKPPEESRRGFTQQPKRRCEDALRRHVVRLSAGLEQLGYPLAARAQGLRVSARTLRQWEYEHRQPATTPVLLGRPVLRASVAQRNAVLDVLETFGPATGVPTLRDCFPSMRRAELADLLGRYRRVWRRRHHQAPRLLHWRVPGAVWAIDFTEAPSPVEGVFGYLLAVRDLASGQQLLWQPVPQANADEVCRALAMLFDRHGAPLVLKSDNGSPFDAEVTLTFLHQAGVLPLFSPPYWPRYNGAIEAAIGSLKTRSERQAARHDRPGHWTCDDVAAAQAEANATARPHGPTGPTPDESWAKRRTITAGERALFRQAVNDHRDELRQEGSSPNGSLSKQEERAMDRQASQRALVEHNYLVFSRRRIPLPFTKKKVTDIM